MNPLISIDKHRKQISQKTFYQYASTISIFEKGLLLLVNSTEILEPIGSTLNMQTENGASKLATWRFLSSLPTSIHWCYLSALYGDYSISKYILRLVLEESIKLAFYSFFPNEALQQINSDRDRDKIKLSDMLEKLEIEHQKELLRLHGELSTMYSHANLILQSELVTNEGERAIIGGSLKYLPDVFEAIIHQLLILLGNALKYSLYRFTELLEDNNWHKDFEFFLHEAENTVKKEFKNENATE